jgi:hypothetical protein
LVEELPNARTLTALLLMVWFQLTITACRKPSTNFKATKALTLRALPQLPLFYPAEVTGRFCKGKLSFEAQQGYPSTTAYFPDLGGICS